MSKMPSVSAVNLKTVGLPGATGFSMSTPWTWMSSSASAVTISVTLSPFFTLKSCTPPTGLPLLIWRRRTCGCGADVVDEVLPLLSSLPPLATATTMATAATAAAAASRPMRWFLDMRRQYGRVLRLVAEDALGPLRLRRGLAELLLERRDLVRAARPFRLEAVAHAEVRVDVAPVGRGLLELQPDLADEHVHGAVAVGHRIAPHRLVDLLALQDLALRLGEQLEQLELAAGEVHAAAAREGLELGGAGLQLARHERASLDALGSALAAPHHGLDARQHLLGVARLRDPVVGAGAQAAHALRHARAAGADDEAHPGQRGGDALDELP